MWNWIVENITTVKELLWIVFTFVATLIAILTYRRARYTLLQPLKTEVIKRQTDLLIKLLDFFDETMMFSFKIDYITMVSLNMYKIITELGFVLSDDSIKQIEETLGGALFVSESGVLSSVEKIDVFNRNNYQQNTTSQFELSKQKYEKAKLGEAELEVIYTTKKHIIFNKDFDELINNPFMPENIKSALICLKEDIHYNLRFVLKEVLEQFIVELCKSENSPSKQNPLQIYDSGLYNEFNRKSKHHENEIGIIKKLIREYLMIDKGWN